jgi:ceramide glucosyltransferase
MSQAEMVLTIWFVGTLVPFVVVLSVGLTRLLLLKGNLPAGRKSDSKAPVEMLVPLKGTFPNQERILDSLAQQDHPHYLLVFILESETDQANSVVDELAARHSHVRKVISGINLACAQKNHNLIVGLEQLKSVTEIVVFCDSTNRADSGWLTRMTESLDSGTAEAVTTFRAFHPQPATLGGLCQAHYASFLLVLTSIFTRPWGGGTAIKRSVLERLHVARTWASTVIDDLTLGNLLEKAGIKVYMNAHTILSSPLKNCPVSGCLGYLDRQILFPKYTNPGIWLTMTLVMTNLAVATAAAVVATVLFPTGLVDGLSGWLGIGFLSVIIVFSFLLKLTNPFPISPIRWTAIFVPSIFMIAFVFVRSIFRNRIVWHGRIYLPGRDGIVLKASFQDNDTEPRPD